MDEFSNVWLWRNPDKRWLHEVQCHINASVPSNNGIIMLHCEDVTDFEQSIPLTNYFFNLYLMVNALEEERTMFMNLKDMISSIELYLERWKKEDKTSENNVSDEEVIEFYNKYVSCFELENEDHVDKPITVFKEFLKQNNCIDLRLLLHECQKLKNSDINNCINDSRYLILGTPCSLVFKQLISILNGKICIICVETPLDISLHGSPDVQTSEKIKVVVESMQLEEIAMNNQHPSKIGSATEEYAEDVILSFLSLLVNSRNELALSKAMISPVISLSHEAFTALKHLSVEKEMPMCQVAISYVTRVRLGGKGYAPSDDCPVLCHLKSLELFVDTLNQMQAIIEEETCPSSAIKRLINTLKKKLLKCDSEKFKNSSVETVSENLQSTLLTISEVLKTRISSGASQICQGTLDILYHFINFINSNSFICSPDIILAKKHLKRTPLNLPPLLGYFRSPEEESTCDTKSSLNDDSTFPRTSMVHHPAFLSYFHHSVSNEVPASCINSSTPSKLTFKDCLQESKEKPRNRQTKESEIYSENSQDTVFSRKSQKYSILSEITNENISGEDKKNYVKNDAKKKGKIYGNSIKENDIGRSNNKKQCKREPKRAAKKFKQIQGQGKITNFFIFSKGS